MNWNAMWHLLMKWIVSVNGDLTVGILVGHVVASTALVRKAQSSFYNVGIAVVISTV